MPTRNRGKMKHRTHCLSAGVLAASALLVVGALIGGQNSAALDSSSSQSSKMSIDVTTEGPQVWSEVSTPDQGSSANALIGVACLGSSCTAVGFYANTSGVEQTLVETLERNWLVSRLQSQHGKRRQRVAISLLCQRDIIARRSAGMSTRRVTIRPSLNHGTVQSGRSCRARIRP